MGERITISRTSLESLVFFIFGATMDDACLLQKIIEKAYIDATNQGAFNARIKKEDITKKADANETKRDVIGLLLEEIKSYTKPKGNTFSKWHLETCQAVIKKYEEKTIKEFTYGNAQKLVNMTLKYLYLLSEIQVPSRNQAILKAIQMDSEFLNVPIDSYIIDALWRKAKETADTEKIRKTLPPKVNKDGKIQVKPKYDKDDYPRPSDYLKGWSQWDMENYLSVQEAISVILGEGAVPMKWESEAWITIARNRQKRHKEKP